MKKSIVVVGILLLTASICGGCFSPVALKHNRRKVALKRAVIADNQDAIKAIRLGDDGVGVGIDVTNLEAAFADFPSFMIQLGAAIGDAGLIYAGYEGIRAIDESLDKDDDTSSSADTSVDVNIEGEDNHVNVIVGTDNDSNQDDESN